MLIKKISWKDPFTDEDREKEFYFHIGMGDLTRIELEYGFKGGLEGVAKAIYEARDAEKIIALFEKLVAMAYGVKTDDGDFVKSKTLTEQFVGGRAYDALFYELVTNSEAGAEFINAAMPKEVRDKVKEYQKQEQQSQNVKELKIPDGPLTNPGATTIPASKAPPFNLGNTPVGHVEKIEEHEGGLAVDMTVDKPLEPAEQEPDRFLKPLEDYTLEELKEMPLERLNHMIKQRKGNVPRAVLNIAWTRANQ